MANPLDKYENLSGVKVNYENGNLYSDEQNIDASTKSLLLLGTASDGPVGEPISVRAIGGPKAAERLFGGMLIKEEIDTGQVNPNTGEPIKKTVKKPSPGSLIRGMYEALDAGNEDVRLMRINGNNAKTELIVHNADSAMEQILGSSKGNVSFSKKIEFENAGRLSSFPIQRILEKRADGTLVKEFSTPTAIANSVVSVDSIPGQETVFFQPNVFRPANTIEVEFNFNSRNYFEVLRSDEDGVLSRDVTQPNYYSSVHSYFSDDLAAGHTINVYVDGIGIPQMNTNGQWLWRPGKEDSTVTNPLTDEYTKSEYEQGGIRFTEAYQSAVASGQYPELTSSTSVVSDYFYYDEQAVTIRNEYQVPGEDVSYELNYLPNPEEFQIYYNLSGEKISLTPRNSENPNGDYSMIYPSGNEKTRVVIKAGSVPVGVQLKASYKTSQVTTVNPKIVVESIFAGEEYAQVKDDNDPDNSIEGVGIDIRHDITPEDPSGKEKIIYFVKPINKRLSMRDEVLEYRTRELKGIRTINEFVNYVNNDSRNNIVRLYVDEGGSTPVQGIAATNGLIFLGQKYNENLDRYETLIDLEREVGHPKRYPWIGTNGFFDRNNLASMKELFETLGGVYELNPNAYNEYRLLKQGVYSQIENYPVDHIVLLEAFANTPIGRETFNTNGVPIVVEDEEKNFATQLAQHCAVASAKVRETIGFIGVEPVRNSGLLAVEEYIEELINSNVNDHFMFDEATFDYILNEEGDPIDVGHYVNVVFGPEAGYFNEKIGSYIASGAVTYAAFNTTLSPEIAPTNKQIPINGLRYKLSTDQHNRLAGARYVTFEERILSNTTVEYRVKEGVTGGQPNSDYQRLSTVNITHATTQLIRNLANPFIGLPNGLAQRNSLKTEIQDGLDRLKDNGLLQDYEFDLYTNPSEKVLGNMVVSLAIVPEFETRRINTNVGLRQSL